MWLYHVPFTICVVSVLTIAFCDQKKEPYYFLSQLNIFFACTLLFLTKRGRQVCSRRVNNSCSTIMFLITGMILFSYLTDFSYFTLKIVFWKLLDLVRTVKKKNGHFGRGCWFQLYFHWFQLFYFLTRIIPVITKRVGQDTFRVERGLYCNHLVRPFTL